MENARGEIAGGWKFQLLTNLGELPDYETDSDDSDPRRSAPRSIATVNPCSFIGPRHTKPRETMASDGVGILPVALSSTPPGAARHRWSSPTSSVVSSTSPPSPCDEPGQVVDDEHDGDLGPFAVAGLREDETLARLATGIKRFSLPDEFNYIKIYRSIAESDLGTWGEHALDVLGEAFENRRQYPRAAEIWEQAIERDGRGEDDFRGKHLGRSRRTGVSSVPRASSRPARRRRSSSASATLGPYGSKPMRSLSRSFSTTQRPT